MADKKSGPKIIGAGITGAAALFAYLLAIRPWLLRWGATADDVHRPLPGDDLVPHPKMESTHAVTIQTPAAGVWPWLVQIGYKRAGWYSYDRIHRVLGVAGCVDDDHRSANRIIPELQHLAVGDTVEIGPGMGYRVAALEPSRALVLYIRLDASTWRSLDRSDPLPEKYLDSSWVWFLDEITAGITRLIVRIRQDYNPSLLNTLVIRGMIEPGSFIMERKTLLGIKRRAESTGRQQGA